MDNLLSRNWSFIFLLQKAVCLVHQTLYLLDDLGVQCYFFQSLYVLGTSPLPEKWLEGHLSRSVGSLRFGDNSFCCAVVPWFHVILFVKFLKLFPELESWSSNPCLCMPASWHALLWQLQSFRPYIQIFFSILHWS